MRKTKSSPHNLLVLGSSPSGPNKIKDLELKILARLSYV